MVIGGGPDSGNPQDPQWYRSHRHQHKPPWLHQGHGLRHGPHQQPRPRHHITIAMGGKQAIYDLRFLTALTSSDLSLPSTIISPPLSLSPTSPPCTHSAQWCPAAWCQGSWLIAFHLGQEGGAMAVLSMFPPAPPNTKRRITWSGAAAKRPILNASQTFQMPAHDFHYCQIAFASASC